MALHKKTLTTKDQIERFENNARQGMKTVNKATVDTFALLWGGDKAQALRVAQAINDLAIEQGTTARAKFDDHGAAALASYHLLGVTPAPVPIDTELLFTADMLDLEKLSDQWDSEMDD
jgi:hypothetical protein